MADYFDCVPTPRPEFHDIARQWFEQSHAAVYRESVSQARAAAESSPPSASATAAAGASSSSSVAASAVAELGAGRWVVSQGAAVDDDSGVCASCGGTLRSLE